MKIAFVFPNVFRLYLYQFYQILNIVGIHLLLFLLLSLF